ncbi:mRNA capping enzyme catalytic domain protein [Theileria parva strain Muguga]|uniref:mRNA guanylyltransferase n=1 Tax=Theileria parva TaxID=5875 RepID=Q4N5D8_THEPA|nr:mRNA capping enzyme catalytic domain protein [Theileria parva strain Muguga]EAN32635.1 mRNA capping enzyme catalytic domain protein [Theileria parva strain Muguga]|eukprot:XP_764918.1 mRNA capping enzyme [Theileria parva strain Muguga]
MYDLRKNKSPLPGTPVESSENKDRVLRKVRELCGWSRPSFPGSQPTSLCRESISLLLRNDYVVCEKSDGVRALLLSASGSIFLIGRLEEVHEIKMKLPVRGNLSQSQQLTLLDGEVVMDENIEDNSVSYRYLCYDGICIQRKSLNKMNLMERLAFVYTHVIVPLRMAGIYSSTPNKPTDGTDNSEAYDKLEIYLKDFFDITQIKHINNISVKLPHISDGLIFTPVNIPYSPGTCKSLLKWKPPHLNTVDFGVDVLYDDIKRPRLVQLFVSDSGTRVFYNEFLAPYGDVYKKIMEVALTDQITQIIVECSWITDSRIYTFIPNLRNPKADIKQRSTQSLTEGKIDYDFDNGTWIEGGWYAERIREDKNLPNHISVVKSVKSSIEDDITFEMLVEEVEIFKKNGKIPLYKKSLLPQKYEVL